tara:strand:+ start:90 stop:473 length:384 start_codon:yes stop_codon:yes gene_type:complete
MEFKNSKKKGDFGVGQAIAYYTKKSYTVSIPITDSQDYDLIIENENGLQKIQVKTTSNGSVNLRIMGGNSGTVQKFGNEVVYDILFAVCDSGEKFEIPKEEFRKHKNSLSLLCGKYDQFKIGEAEHR